MSTEAQIAPDIDTLTLSRSYRRAVKNLWNNPIRVAQLIVSFVILVAQHEFPKQLYIMMYIQAGLTMLQSIGVILTE